MTGRLLWVRQYAHSTTNMGRAHIAHAGTTSTLCGQGIRDTAVWGQDATRDSSVQDMCFQCRRAAFGRENLR